VLENSECHIWENSVENKTECDETDGEEEVVSWREKLFFKNDTFYMQRMTYFTCKKWHILHETFKMFKINVNCGHGGRGRV